MTSEKIRGQFATGNEKSGEVKLFLGFLTIPAKVTMNPHHRAGLVPTAAAAGHTNGGA
jgi:hypothetical protein